MTNTQKAFKLKKYWTDWAKLVELSLWPSRITQPVYA